MSEQDRTELVSNSNIRPAAEASKKAVVTNKNTSFSPWEAKERMGRGFQRVQSSHQGNLSRSVEHTAGRNVDRGRVIGPTLTEQQLIFRANPKLVSTYKAAGFSDETIFEMLKDMRD